MLNKKTVDDLKDLKGKKVLVRCDFNVPLKDGVIQNYNRIDGALPTIKKLLDQGAKVILCSHLGKPKGEPLPEMSLAPVAPALSERLGVPVKFISDPQVTGEETRKAAADLKDGEVLLLENTRYRGEETKYGKDEAAEKYAEELAALCDDGIFVDDAFGTAHRAHCSNVGVTKYCKENVVGYLMEKEIRFLGQAVENPVRPFVAILGGAKVSDKLNVINNLLDKVDTLIIGGGMAYTFLKAEGQSIGNSLCEVLDRANHLARVGVLVVIPRDNLNLIATVRDLADHGLGCIEEGAVAHADDIGGDNLIRVVAEGLVCRCLHRCVDLFLRDLILRDNRDQNGRGTGRDRDTLCGTDELAVQLRNDQADCLCRTGGVRDNVRCACSRSSEIALSLRAVENHLIAGVSVNGAHDAGLNRRVVVQCLCHRCEAVRRAGSCGNNLVFLGQRLLVDVVHDGRQIVACRCRDDNLLCACLKVSRSLLLRGVETGALQDNIDIQSLPRKVLCVCLLVNRNLLAVDGNGILTCLDRVLALAVLSEEATLRSIILQQVRQHLRLREIVDRNNLIALRLKHLAERKASDTSKSVNRNFNHGFYPPVSAAEPN